MNKQPDHHIEFLRSGGEWVSVGVLRSSKDDGGVISASIVCDPSLMYWHELMDATETQRQFRVNGKAGLFRAQANRLESIEPGMVTFNRLVLTPISS